MCTVYRGFAKRTLLKTARKAGIKTKDMSSSSKRQKYGMVTGATPPMTRRSNTLSSADMMMSDAGLHQQQQLTMFDDDLSGQCLIQAILKASVDPVPAIAKGIETSFYLSRSVHLNRS